MWRMLAKFLILLDLGNLDLMAPLKALKDASSKEQDKKADYHLPTHTYTNFYA